MNGSFSFQHTCSVRRARRSAGGFTLVELLVALTGGLFLSMVVFALARDSSRFYQRETRLANATLAGVVGFDRLRADIARAGFLTTPNIEKDPHVCSRPDASSSDWPDALKTLAALRLTKSTSAPETLSANGITPMTLLLAGSYGAIDEFPVRTVVNGTSEYQVYLQVNTGPLRRLSYETGTPESGIETSQEAILESVFMKDRIVRIVDKSGYQHFGVVKSVLPGNDPAIILSNQPPIEFRGTSALKCGLKGLESGATINVVNLIRYEIGSLKDEDDYKPLYEASTAPFDEDRSELIRTELGADGQPLAGTTPELVAEYAVDLAFGFTAWQVGTNDGLTTVTPDGDFEEFFPSGTIGPVQHLRAIRARLSVRSREGDRPEPVNLPGLYRIGLGADAGAPFARVRTLQADIALHNLGRTEWE
jgi:type II secretory pathway pseudopilin PulG